MAITPGVLMTAVVMTNEPHTTRALCGGTVDSGDGTTQLKVHETPEIGLGTKSCPIYLQCSSMGASRKSEATEDKNKI